MTAEALSDNSSPQTTPVAEKKTKDKSARRSGSFEDGNDKEDKWKLFTDLKGKFTKTLDEIKTERWALLGDLLNYALINRCNALICQSWLIFLFLSTCDQVFRFDLFQDKR